MRIITAHRGSHSAAHYYCHYGHKARTHAIALWAGQLPHCLPLREHARQQTSKQAIYLRHHRARNHYKAASAALICDAAWRTLTVEAHGSPGKRQHLRRCTRRGFTKISPAVRQDKKANRYSKQRQRQPLCSPRSLQRLPRR
jgi:hypothetical protein